MPCEIGEVSITATIDDEAPSGATPSIDVEELRDEILQECAEMIRRAIERQWDR